MDIHCTLQPLNGIHATIARGSLKDVQELLKNPEIDLNSHDDGCGWTPLHVASRRGDVRILQLLLADPRVGLEEKDHMKSTPLRHAVSTGHHAAACELLVAGADAKNGLLPFIMLDSWNSLVAYLQRSTSELEAQLQPHRTLKHRLALLLHKHSILPPLPAGQPQQQGEQAVLEQQQDMSKQQGQQPVVQPSALRSMQGVQRDAAELMQAAQTIKQLRVEVQKMQQPISPAMCHAIVSLVKACSEAAGDADAALERG